MYFSTFKTCSDLVKRFFSDEEAQGITEYGAILAFVALLVALTFGFTGGQLAGGLSKAFMAVSSQLNDLSSTATAASS